MIIGSMAVREREREVLEYRAPDSYLVARRCAGLPIASNNDG